MRALLLFVVAVAAAVAVMVGMRQYGAATPSAAGFVFDASAFADTPGHVVAALGGPLTAVDIETIRRVSRAEIERAFTGLDIRVRDDGAGFWRIRVVGSVVPRTLSGRPMQNTAGASYAFGPLGGGGFLSFSTLAHKAVLYAPAGATRAQVVEGLGRGIGRSAVHEFVHLILGSRSIHSGDERTYEFETADRPAQYYGELTWASARPLLLDRLGAAR